MNREGAFGVSSSWAALAAAWILSASLATAQAPEPRVPLAPPLQAPPVPQDSARWLVTPNEMILSELVAGAAAAIGVPIDFNQADLQGTVTVRIPERVSAEELWELANLSLAARGLTTVQVPGGRSVGVVKLEGAAALARLEESGLRASQAGFVKLALPLASERTDAASEAIKLVLSKHGSVVAFRESRTLVVTDLRPHVAQAIRVAALFDSARDAITVDQVPLSRTTPVALVALLDKITAARKTAFGETLRGTVLADPEGRGVLLMAPREEKVYWLELIHEFDAGEEVVTRHYSPRRFGLGDTAKLIEEVAHEGGTLAPGSVSMPEAWRLVVDELTGSIIITTTPRLHLRVEDVLRRVEETAPETRRPIRSFPVRNRGVEELKGLLEGLLDAGALREALKPDASAQPGTVPQGPTAPLTNASATVRATHSDDLGGQDVILTADRSTNRLIAMGEARVLDELARLIGELDVRTPQVLVEAIVVTLTESDTRSLGVELQKLEVDGDIQGRIGSLFGLGSPDPSIGPIPALTGTGFSGVVLDPGNFSAIVRALQTINDGRTVTMPKVLVNNNQPAVLNSVLQTPYASTNASTTVATTSFGGTQDAGTQITVTPQVADGDQLVLSYTVSLSAFVGTSADPNLPPPRQENRLQSIVTVPDGYAVVVGGLEIARDTESRSQVPFLGDLPLIGPLFGSRTLDEGRSRFFVFLRCTVERSQSFEALRYLGEKDFQAAGIEDGWPRMEPRWIR